MSINYRIWELSDLDMSINYLTAIDQVEIRLAYVKQNYDHVMREYVILFKNYSVLVIYSSACEQLLCQVTVNITNHKTAVMSYAVIAK